MYRYWLVHKYFNRNKNEIRKKEGDKMKRRISTSATTNGRGIRQ